MTRARPRWCCVALTAALVVTALAWAGTGSVWSAQTIRQIGSTTLLPMAEKWRVEFNKEHPGVDIAVSGGGSGTGIKALIAGTAEVADASRPMKDKEVEQAEEVGVHPVQHVVAYDGIAVIVHPSNPLREVSLEDLSDIYTGGIRRWDALGVRGLGDIQVVNRDSASGTYEVFKEIVVQLEGRDKSRNYAAHTLNQASNQAVLALVGRTRTAIGYVGLGYLDDTVKALRIIPKPDHRGVAPNLATVSDGSYPIARELYCYTNGQPRGMLRLYMDWIKGPKGQAIAKEVGFVPLTD